MITRVIRVSTRLTTNPGASLTRIGRLRSLSPTLHTVARVTSSVSAARTTSSSGISPTGLKKCMPATRAGCCSSAAMSVIDSADVFVASTQSSRTTCSSSASTRCLTSSSSNTASRTRSQSAKPSVVRSAGDERGEEASLPLVVATLRDLCVDLRTDVRERVVDDLLRDVADDDGHLESAEEEQRDLARHQPASDDPDPADVERRRVRPRRMTLRPLLDEVERVDGRLRLCSWQELADRLLLPAIAVLERPLLRALDEVECGVRRGRRAVNGVVDARPCAPEDRLGVGPVRLRPLLRILRQLPRKGERFVDELDRFQKPVGDPELAPPASR